jgi:predicted esterase
MFSSGPWAGLTILRDHETPLDFVHEFVPGTSERTLLLLHGTGGNERDLLALGQTLDPAAALLSPRGKVLENGMPRFFRRLAEGVFDLADLRKRTYELADFVTAAAGYYGIDPANLVAVGYSNGANIAASLLLLRPETLRNAILLRAMVPLIPDRSPDLGEARVLICAGEHDPIIPVGEGQRLATLLRNFGAQLSLHVSRADHGLTREDMEVGKRWLAELDG